jgi:hypothetical protein
MVKRYLFAKCLWIPFEKLTFGKDIFLAVLSFCLWIQALSCLCLLAFHVLYFGILLCFEQCYIAMYWPGPFSVGSCTVGTLLCVLSAGPKNWFLERTGFCNPWLLLLPGSSNIKPANGQQEKILHHPVWLLHFITWFKGRAVRELQVCKKIKFRVCCVPAEYFRGVVNSVALLTYVACYTDTHILYHFLELIFNTRKR